MSTPSINGPREWSPEHEKARREANFEIMYSPAMYEVFWQMTRVRRGSNVLLTGETGTGKTNAARLINTLLRVNHPELGDHVEVNIAALPQEVVPDELFGHTKGSFTGAIAQRVGRFEFANGGTLMLDEIGDVDKPTQVKMLSAFDDPRQLQRIGSNDPVPVDLVAITGTTRNLKEMVGVGSFNRALYERLSERVIHMPSLAERGSAHIGKLVPTLLKKIAGNDRQVLSTDPAVLKRIELMRFSGNARALFFLLKEMSADAYDISSGRLTERHLDNALIARGHSEDQDRNAGIPTLEEVERRHILAVLKGCGGKIGTTAEVLGIGIRTLQRKLESMEMRPKADEEPVLHSITDESVSRQAT